MAGVEKRDFDSPDESRTPDKTKVDVVHLGGTTAARFAMEQLIGTARMELSDALRVSKPGKQE